MSPLRCERGGALVETAILVPVLLFVVAAGSFTVRLVLDYTHINHVTETAARYATRAGADPEDAEYRLRRTPEDVEAYVRRIAAFDITSVSVEPDPTTVDPGTTIRVEVRTHTDLGPLGRAANAIAGAFAWLVGGGKPFPDDGIEIGSVAHMREE